MLERAVSGVSFSFVVALELYHCSSSPRYGQINPADGYEWLEHPEGSGIHYMRAQKSDDWTKWQG